MITYVDLVEPKSKVTAKVHSHRESTLECGVCYAYTREQRKSVVRPCISFIMSISPSTSVTTANPVFLVSQISRMFQGEASSLMLVAPQELALTRRTPACNPVWWALA